MNPGGVGAGEEEGAGDEEYGYAGLEILQRLQRSLWMVSVPGRIVMIRAESAIVRDRSSVLGRGRWLGCLQK